MRMRTFASILLASVLGASGAAHAQKVEGPKVSWKLGTWGKPRAVTAGVEHVAAYVKEKTGGNFTISIGYESFGDAKELLDILSVGGLEMTMICSSYHPDKHPAYTVLDLPFLPMPTFDIQWAVHEAVHKHPYILQEMKKWNAVPYNTNLLPQYEFVGRGKPPKTIADFKGMRVRAIGGIGEAMKNLGAVPTSVPASEVYTSFERGTVDAASFPSTYAHGSYKTNEIGKWFTENLAPGTQACPTLFNINAWNKLPPQYQKLFDEAKPAMKDKLTAAYKVADDKNIPLFKKTLEFIRYSDADLEEFRKVGAKPVWDAWIKEKAAKGIPAQEIFDLMMNTAKAAAKKS